VIAYNDLMAIGVMHALLLGGVRIPEQVSVIGFDDILTSGLVLPTLTTVAAPTRQMGMTAIKSVVAVIHGAKPNYGEPKVIATELAVRESTGQRRPEGSTPALGTTSVPGQLA